MAKITPFRGIKYAVPNLEDVICPPYDVISPEDRVYYHRKSPLNFVRLVLGEEFLEDTERDNQFTRAGSYLDSWLRDGVMRRDENPAIYVYEQDYTVRGKRFVLHGITCLVKLAAYDEGDVLPHEETLAKPRSELLKLIRETRANLDSVYGLYPDPEHALDGIMEETVVRAPELEGCDKDGVTHRLWTVDDPADIGAVAGHLAVREIVIADGHHRYETALAYRDEMRAVSPSPEEAPYDYVMMTMFNAYGRDMMVFPTHRLVRNLSKEEDARLEKLDDLFHMLPAPSDSLLDSMAANGKVVGMYRRGKAHVLIPKENVEEMLPYSPAMNRLDVAVLHGLILERELGINTDRLREQTNLAYSRNEQDAINCVNEGECQVAFLLNPIDVEAILQVAREGERMPQKATYFYPKLLSGLVLRRIE